MAFWRLIRKKGIKLFLGKKCAESLARISKVVTMWCFFLKKIRHLNLSAIPKSAPSGKDSVLQLFLKNVTQTNS